MTAPASPPDNAVPRAGMLATVRNRRGVVAAVEPFDGERGRLHLVHLEYKDDHAPSEERLLWELEPSRHLLEPNALPDPALAGAMPADDFDALLRAARWTALSPYLAPGGGADEGPDPPPHRERVASPFHGGVRIESYQLVPLLKALRMPRVSLLIADDVGLGKTVEAGLILTELLLRRRIRRVLVLTPASLRRQWREELWEKFSLRFEVVDRLETESLRRRLGMDANPWRAFSRIVASYHYLRQPDVLEQFLSACRTPEDSPHLPWDLLIVDECHNLMPSPFGEDSELCRMLGVVAPRFEHRLFLSATPHNGHTRSFTGLLEVLDPVRFTRTNEMNDAMRGRVEDVVIRRLKRDINAADLRPEPGRAVGGPARGSGPEPRRARGSLSPGSSLQPGSARGNFPRGPGSEPEESKEPLSPETNPAAPRFCTRLPPEALLLDTDPREARLSAAFDAFRDAVRALVSGGTKPRRHAGTFAVEILGKRLLSCPTAFAESWSRARQGFAEQGAGVGTGGAATAATTERELAATERAVRQETGDDAEAEQRAATAATVVGAWLRHFAGEVQEEIRGIERSLDALGFHLGPEGVPITARTPVADARFDTLIALIERLLRTRGEPRPGKCLRRRTEGTGAGDVPPEAGRERRVFPDAGAGDADVGRAGPENPGAGGVTGVVAATDDDALRAADFRPDERLIVFTEYKTTLDYLARRLRERYSAGRVLTLYGAGGPEGMDEAGRENVKAAFNDPASPVRVLVATDAASEGLDLHRTARYLLHYDCPWNPSRLEQRNGRLDRYGQARDVTVHHFVSNTDPDLRFLDHVIRKADEIREDLGSVNEVFDRAAHRRLIRGEDAASVQADLDRGIDAARGSASVILAADARVGATPDEGHGRGTGGTALPGCPGEGGPGREGDVPRRRVGTDAASATAFVPDMATDGTSATPLPEAIAAMAAEVDLDAYALCDTLDTAMAVPTAGRPQLRQVAEEPGFYRVLRPDLPGWREVIDEAVRRPAPGGGRGPVPRLAFGTEPFIERIGPLSVFTPRADAVLMHLAHPMMQRALGVLTRRRYPGAGNEVSRWTVRAGEVPDGAEALILLSVEEIGVNALRETFHRWVRTLALPVRDGALGEPLAHVPALTLRGALEIHDPEERERAGDLLEGVRPGLRRWLREYRNALTERLRRRLAADGDTARRREDERYRQRQGEVSALIAQSTMARLTREIEQLGERRRQGRLFDEGERLAEIEQSIEEKQEELRRRRHHYEEIREQLRHERTRILERLLPARFALAGEAQVFPVAVEVRLPEQRRS